jgi:hypothetical protein
LFEFDEPAAKICSGDPDDTVRTGLTRVGIQVIVELPVDGLSRQNEREDTVGRNRDIAVPAPSGVSRDTGAYTSYP